LDSIRVSSRSRTGRQVKMSVWCVTDRKSVSVPVASQTDWVSPEILITFRSLKVWISHRSIGGTWWSARTETVAGDRLSASPHNLEWLMMVWYGNRKSRSSLVLNKPFSRSEISHPHTTTHFRSSQDWKSNQLCYWSNHQGSSPLPPSSPSFRRTKTTPTATAATNTDNNPSYWPATQPWRDCRRTRWSWNTFNHEWNRFTSKFSALLFHRHIHL
jgi:hypothetical protein